VLALAPLAGPAVAVSKSSANGRLPLLEELLDEELLDDDELDEELLDDDELDEELLDEELEELDDEPPPGWGIQPLPPA
jgi:hypothetical protein